MTDDEMAESELKGTGYELFIAALSVLSITNIVLHIVIRDAALESVLDIMNVILSIVFLGDFAYRLATAESTSQYFFREFGWADLLASLPFAQAKLLRLFRLLRVARLMRRYGARAIGRSLVQDRAGSALFMLLLMGLLVVQFGALAILKIEETADGSNIDTPSDAVWYVIVTISTVGYGDRFPVTNAGRIFGSAILILGVGIFGAFTGYLANAFLAPRQRNAPDPDDDDPSAQLDRLRELMQQQQEAIDELERRLGSAR
jgi:Ion transport protein